MATRRNTRTSTKTTSPKASPTKGKESYKNPLASLSFEGKITLNSEQKEAAASIFNPDSITVLTGEAGTGKTAVSMYTAFKLLKTKYIKQVVVTRPTVEAGGRNLGFMPGELDDKLGVYLEPFREFCALFGNSGPHTFDDMVRMGQLKPVAFQFLRGVNFDDETLVIVDEAENCNLDEVLLILTRMKEGSRIVFTGDLRQKDTRKSERSGLDHLLKVATRLNYIRHHNLVINERSPRIREIVNTWDSML